MCQYNPVTFRENITLSSEALQASGANSSVQLEQGAQWYRLKEAFSSTWEAEALMIVFVAEF